MIMEVDKSKICSVVLQAPDTGESMVQMKPEVILLKNFLLLEKDWSFVSVLGKINCLQDYLGK